MSPVISRPTRASGTVVILAVAVVAGLMVHLFGAALGHGMDARAHAPSPGVAAHGVAAEPQAANHAPIELAAGDEGHDEADCASLVAVSTGAVAPVAGCALSAWSPPFDREAPAVTVASAQPAHPVEPLLRSPGLQRI